MAKIDLEVWLQGWQQGRREAFRDMHDWLAAKFFPFAERFLRPFVGDDDLMDDDKATDGSKHGPSTVTRLARDAFSALLEELSLRVEDGDEKLLTVLTEQVRKKPAADGTTVEVRVFRGKVTGRLLAEREKFTWQGQQAFERLCREILIMQCRQVRREHYRRKHIPLDPNPHEEEPRGSYNGQIIGSVSEGETGIVQREAVYESVEGLAQFSEQLRYKGKEAESETIEALLLYVKSKVAQTNPAYAAYNVEALRSVPIERLLCHSSMCTLDADEEEAWQFVQDTLKLSRDTIYQRKRRLCRQMQSLPVPDSLRAVLGLLWLRDLRNLVEDCQERVGDVDEHEATMLHIVDVFLRWLFARGHPSHNMRLHREAGPEWLAPMSPQALFTSNNPQLLTPRYPGAGGFRQFVTQYYPNPSSAVKELPRLQAALERLKPHPIRLLSVIKTLI